MRLWWGRFTEEGKLIDLAVLLSKAVEGLGEGFRVETSDVPEEGQSGRTRNGDRHDEGIVRRRDLEVPFSTGSLYTVCTGRRGWAIPSSSTIV